MYRERWPLKRGQNKPSKSPASGGSKLEQRFKLTAQKKGWRQ